MGDSVFNIKITAVDNATKVVNKVNKSVSQIFRPYDNAKKSTKSFFDALGKNDLIARPLSGLTKLGGAIGSIGSSFGIAENSVIASSSRMAASIGSIGGPFGALAAGAVVAAGTVGSITVKMATLGFDIAKVAKFLGVTTNHLQEYRGAAQLAGLTTDSMDSSLGNLGTTLQDASAGRNMQAATLLTQMGITVQRTKEGAVDTVQAYRDIAGVVSKITDPNIAKKMTDILGISESLPLLREGTTALDGYIAKARRAGLVQSTELVNSNQTQAKSWMEIKGAIEGVGISVGNLIADMVNLGKVSDMATKAAETISKKQDAKQSPTIGSAFRPALAAIGMGPYGVYRALKGELYGYGTNPSAGSRSVSGKVTDLTGNAAIDSVASGVPRGIRTNNPGNLRSWSGAGSSGGFAQFASPEDGLKAAGKNLIAYQEKYGINTINKIISRWAPASDNNNVPAYVSAMSKSTGFGADQQLDMKDPKVLAPLISAITKHENGQNPYDADTIAKAAVAAVKEAQSGPNGGSNGQPIQLVVQGLPQGMTIKAVRGLGQSTVGQTMQPGGMS